MIEVNWSFFKSFLASTSVGFVYVDEPNSLYSVYAAYQGLTLKCYISNSEKTEFEASYKASGNKKLSSNSPFGAKEIDGKKLFKRVHGISEPVSSGANEILFTVPYNWVKINGIELINTQIGDTASFYVLDTSSGTYSGIADATLNQFAFNANLDSGFYRHTSEFDADLFLNMKIKIVYNSISSKTIGINFMLNELK